MRVYAGHSGENLLTGSTDSSQVTTLFINQESEPSTACAISRTCHRSKQDLQHLAELWVKIKVSPVTVTPPGVISSDRGNFKPTVIKYDSATIRARALRESFISLISLSTSSMNLWVERGHSWMVSYVLVEILQIRSPAFGVAGLRIEPSQVWQVSFSALGVTGWKQLLDTRYQLRIGMRTVAGTAAGFSNFC